jgi:hypothetical protein
MNNIFVSDPLLSQQNDYGQRIEELRKMQEELERRTMKQQPSQSPVWDEINRVMSDMSDREYEYLREDEEFKQSEQRIASILNEEYMKVMRPIVEGTQEGKEALENHLKLVRSIRKKAVKESDKEMGLFKEYMEKYPHMTYKEFKEMKGEKV